MIGGRSISLCADAVPALLAYVDREERYRFANASYHRWFGFDPRSIVGKNLREVLGPDASRLTATTTRTVSLDVSSMFVDVLRCDAAAESEDGELLREAVDLYRGPLLEGCT